MIFLLESVEPSVLVAVIVHGAIEVSTEFIEPVMYRVEPRFSAKVPFPEQRSSVAALFHEPWNRQFAGVEPGRIQVACDDIHDSHTLLVPACEESGPRRAAYGTVGVKVRKA